MTNRLIASGKRHPAKLTLVFLASGLVLAATTFLPNKQPWGYISPPALNTGNLSKSGGMAYTPWFNDSNYAGDLLALPVNKNGSVILLTPTWRASLTVENQNFSTGRRIVTTDGAGTAIPFRYDSLTDGQKTITSQNLVNFIRGDRSNEGSSYRERFSLIGDIIHSNPVYVARPSAGYGFDGYLGFASSNAARAPRVYVGANDGMVHAFDAANGDEVFAYIPSMVYGNLPKLGADPYVHQYYVDGFLTAGDAKFSGAWHSVLVGGLGAGGKGYFGLDITSAAAATESAAADKVLWEFTTTSTGAANLGYSYSRPSIVKMNSGDWAAVVGNGYLSATGKASLYILNIATGAVIAELVVSDSSANGMSSPTLIDIDSNGTVDLAYAGDLNGNVWKFDLKSGSSGGWSVAHGGLALGQTAVSGTSRQPITTAPEVGHHPRTGVMVYVGTGRLFSMTDGSDKSTQAVYGFWDNNWGSTDLPLATTDLVTQTLRSKTHANGASVRTASANAVDWDVHRGWMTTTEIEGAAAADKGERVIQDLLLRDGRISFMTVNPTVATGENWFIQLNAKTGGAPTKTIVDVNVDFVLDVLDNVDGDGNGTIADLGVDRVVGEYQSFGLASRPTIGGVGGGKDTALINHLTAIVPAPVIGDPDDPGLIGGHFDLDTSHLIYPYGGGATDGHVHEWDDKHDAQTIDYFALPDGDGSPLYEITDGGFGITPGDEFILTITNDDLSPGGVLEFNGLSIGVQEYRSLQQRYLAGALLPGETFPRLVLGTPSAAQAAAGVVELKSLKMSFDAYAILTGELIGTKTGCVKGNDPGANGEYRNGALMVQALDASGAAGGFTFDSPSNQWVASSASIDGQHGYATSGLFWESTIFWHWDGPCYGESDWQPMWDACFVTGGETCYEADDGDSDKADKKKSKDKDKDDDDGGSDPGDGGDPPPDDGTGDPGHTVTNTTIGGGSDVGRLFWRELIPQE